MRSAKAIVVALTALAASIGAAAAETVGREDQFKAAYVFNFLKFVEWPSSVPNDVLTVCVVGSDGVYQSLATDADSKRAGTRRLVVRHLDRNADPQGCNALYVEATFETAFAHPVAPAEQPMLTVSDASGFTQRGGMIELFTVRNRLRFAINADNANKAGLRISSNLLQLAAQAEGSVR